MLGAWALAGLFAAPASPLFSIVVGESVPEQVRGTAIGIWSSCENLGGVFANNVAAKALASYGWRSAFFVSGPLVAIWSVVLWAVLPADSTATSVSKKEKGKAKSDAPATSALSIPGVAATAGAYTLTKCARYCLMFWLPYFLSKAPEGPHFSPAAAGSIASLLDLAGTIGAIATGVACDRLYGGATLRAASHLCAATGFSFCVWAVACLYGANANVHVMTMMLVGFFIAGPGGVLGASAKNLVGFAGRGKEAALVAAVSGLVNGSASAGAVAQSLVASQLVSLLGWGGLFALLGLLMVSASVSLWSAIAIEAFALAKKKGE